MIGASDAFHDERTAISPDARAVAYEVAAAPDAASRVEVMSLTDMGSGRAGQVQCGSAETIGFEPAWKPDGSGLVFVSGTGRSRTLTEMIGHGPGRAPFMADAGDLYFGGEWPAVSPDGTTVAVSVGSVQEFQTGWRTTRQLDHALGVSDLLGTGITLLGEGTDPAWSPDGKRIAFVRTTEGHAHLFVATADVRNAEQITFGSADDEKPSFSPDGRFIVFCSAHREEGRAQANLFALRPDGSGLVQLTEGDRFACRPSWGRDGFVYFHVNANDRFHIWRIRPLGALADGQAQR